MNVFLVCVGAAGILLLAQAVKSKSFKIVALGLGYGALLYAGFDAVRGLF